eukprot:6560_1
MSSLYVVCFASIVALAYGGPNTFIPPEDFDCPMRQLALKFAMTIQPFLAADKLQQIADALNGAKEAVNRSCVSVPTDWKLKKTLPPSWDDLNDDDNIASIYVDFIRGNDANDGSIHSPLQHLDA